MEAFDARLTARVWDADVPVWLDHEHRQVVSAGGTVAKTVPIRVTGPGRRAAVRWLVEHDYTIDFSPEVPPS